LNETAIPVEFRYATPKGFIRRLTQLQIVKKVTGRKPGEEDRETYTEDSSDIRGKLSTEDCETCHRAERVEACDYKPLVYGGAH